jgi:ParB family transcriptional regulator, chromosome partitioning protein
MADAFIPPRPVTPPRRFMVALDAIDVGERLRPIDRDYVQALAASFSEQGQIQPIRVRPAADGGNRLQLVAGGHRVEAARLLGWTDIEATLRDLTDDEARIEEIDENVFRQELSALDLAVSLSERKRLYEAAHPEAAHGKAKKPKTEKGKVANLSTFASFSKDAARKTGLSERSVRRHVELVKALGPGTIAVLRATPLADNAAQLKALAGTRRQEREAIMAALVAGKASNVARAREAAGIVKRPDAEEQALDGFMAAMARLDLKQLKARLSILQDTIRLREAGKAGAEKAKAAKPTKAGRS